MKKEKANKICLICGKDIMIWDNAVRILTGRYVPMEHAHKYTKEQDPYLNHPFDYEGTSSFHYFCFYSKKRRDVPMKILSTMKW